MIEDQVRTVLQKYGAPGAAPEILDIFRHNNQKKLSASDAQAIRAMYWSGQTQRSIARHYGVNPATVSRIIRGVYH